MTAKLLRLTRHKSPGNDGLVPSILIEFALIIAIPLYLIFDTGSVLFIMRKDHIMKNI